MNPWDDGEDPGGNALTAAVRARDVDAVRDALAQGFHPDAPEAVDAYGRSPLQLAVADVQDVGDALVRVLLDGGAHPDGNAHSEGTPLETAAFYGEASVIELLVRYGADTARPGFEGAPLAVARRERQNDAVLMLCALGVPRAEWPLEVSEDDVREFWTAWSAHEATRRERHHHAAGEPGGEGRTDAVDF